VLSDNGREFCGREDRHPYEQFLQLEDIEHKRNPGQPATIHPERLAVIARYKWPFQAS
jgi:hypothetical protein